MFHRIISPYKSNSFFLFGARGTGKTTFLKSFFGETKTYWIDLLDPLQEETFSLAPQNLKATLTPLPPAIEWIVIDEVQKVPKLLDLVHQLIEEKKLKFALTGSSARKLKRGGANMLAGRAFLNHLYPLTHAELGDSFDLMTVLAWGSLPKLNELISHEEKKAYLQTYVQTYIKEEIVAEQVIRKLNPFRRFLEVAAQSNGEIVNYSNIAKDAGADTKTVQSYFQILEDTLLGFMLPAYHRSVRKQQMQNPKFYFFDIGVARALHRTLDQPPVPNTYAFGKTFEHFVILEMFRLNEYHKKDYRFFYLRSKDQQEIDLIIDRPGTPPVLIEIKSSEKIDERDLKTLNLFLPDFKGAEALCISRDTHDMKFGPVRALPWQKAMPYLGLS